MSDRAKPAGSWWWQTVAAPERAVLDPSLPDRLPRAVDVLVVGGGLVGVATAVACQDAGLGRVALVEAERLGAGASGGAAGLLLPGPHRGADPAHFADLGVTSLALWRQLHEDVPGGVGLVDLDWIGLEPHPQGWTPPPEAEHLDANDVAGLIPDLAIAAPGVLIRHQARVDPLVALARLAALLPIVATGAAVTGVSTSGGRVAEVTTTAGVVSPGTVVFATGGPPQVTGLELAVGHRPVRGHLLVIDAAALRLPGTVAPFGTTLGDGRLLAGGTEDVQLADEVDPGIVASIRRDLDRAFPTLAGVATNYAWSCFRPAHADHLPIIDQVPGLTNAWFTSGHYRTGILMAPAAGQALAAWVANEVAPPNIAGLTAGRLAARHQD